MKKSTSIWIGLMVAGCWLVTGVLWAKPPFPVPAKGGLPACQAELAECTDNLTITTGELMQCESALAECEANAQKLPATGQTTCWDSTGAVIDDCAGTGQDGDIRAGAVLSYTDTGLTIIDNNTGLEWMKQDDNGGNCASLPGSLDKDCRFTWGGAFAFVDDQLNTDPCFAGHCDWRVPNPKELESIRYYEGNPEDIALRVSEPFHSQCVAGCTVDDPENACSCTSASAYWSSATSAFDPPRAWRVSFGSGPLPNPRDKTLPQLVRAVRGGL